MRAGRCVRLALVAAGVLASINAHAQTAQQPRKLDPAKVEAFMNGAVRSAMKLDHVAGVGVAVIDGEGIVLAKGYGMAAPGRCADADTLFRVGSISKTPTWIALMQLVEEGKIRLDDPINAHLPKDLQIPDEGYKEPIRVWNLMTHSAGFEDSILGHIFPTDPNTLLPMEQFLARDRVHRVRPPGELAVYSNYGAGLAGMIVSHESGVDWPTYAEEHILKPLGMRGATYRDPLPAAIARAHGLAAPMSASVAAHVTQGWKYENGQLVVAPYELVSHVASAGSLSMSPNAAARYMQALLDPALLERAGVLKAATFRTMLEPSFSNVEAFGLIRHGFFTYDLGGGRWGFGHDGGLASHFSRLVVSPEMGVGYFISVNSQSGGPLLNAVSEAFLAEFFPLPKEAQATRPKDARAMAARFAGAYRPLRRPYFRTERAIFSLAVTNIAALPNGDLVASGLGSDVVRLVPVGEDTYRPVGEPGRVLFRERNGRMMLFDSFGVGPAERIGFFASARWFIVILVLGVITAIGGIWSGLLRVANGRETMPALLLDGLCLLWLVSLSLLLPIMTVALSDPTSLTGPAYPGPWLPLSCWLMLAAALLTPVAAIAALFLRPTDWSAFRWVRASAAIVVFAALALTLWPHGFLGFSDF